MHTFTNLLVPSDYSECADDALAVAGDIARTSAGRITVLHLLPIDLGNLFGNFPAPQDAEHLTAETARLRIHAAAVLERDDTPPPFDVQVAWGVPALDVVPYAIEHRIDLIVAGTHGRSGVKHVLLGSVAERIVRAATCPVLTVRPGVKTRGVRRAAAVDARERDVSPGAVLRVEHLMTAHPITVLADDLLLVARDRMAAQRVRHLPVVEDGRLVGVLSDRDLPAHAGHLDRTRVNAAMTPDPVTVSRETAVDDAARLMIARHVRALPVLDGDHVVGILSAQDVLEDYLRAARDQPTQQGV